MNLMNFCNSAGKREIDGQLSNTQSTLVIQSESLRRSEREQKQLTSRSDGLEQAVAALEAEKRQLQVMSQLASIWNRFVWLHCVYFWGMTVNRSTWS